jgi:hypothetical protein
VSTVKTNIQSTQVTDMQIEKVIQYYGHKLDVVKEARCNARSKWALDYFTTLESQLKRHMNLALANIK